MKAKTMKKAHGNDGKGDEGAGLVKITESVGVVAKEKGGRRSGNKGAW